MTPMEEKSILTLELPRILELWAAQAVSEPAKERAVGWKPASDLDTARQWQAETTAACTILAARSAPSFLGVTDITAATKRAGLGGILSMHELLKVAQLLSAARQVKAIMSSPGETLRPDDCLRVYFSAILGNKHLEDTIQSSILSEDEMADSASPILADIRRHKRVAANRIREVLQRIITSATYGKILQEPIITVRADRFVVPVKSEHRSELPGLTHDVSSSGSTFFIEPAQVVSLNNEIRELAAREQHEIERILTELSQEVAASADIIENDFHSLVSLDLIFARAKLSYEMEAVPPVLLPGGQIDLRQARHPLLPKGRAVPITVSLGASFDTLVITGPNTGGKTVTLKTLGLLCLMFRCGLHIPAQDGSGVSFFPGVYADIGDEQSIEQSLSTFSSHMSNIVRILEQAERGSLLLFDELGAGTDPAEGAALAVAILQFTRRNEARIAATTHYAELKIFATVTAGVENASCEFDVETLRPTYRLLVGIPGKSNAFAIARRLGLPESVIQDAGERVGQESARLEDVLSHLEGQRKHLENTQMGLESGRRRVEEDARRAAELRETLERERGVLLDRARAEARRIVDNARAETERILRTLDEERKKDRQSVSDQERNAMRAELRRHLNEAASGIGGGFASADEMAAPSEPTRPIRVGDIVKLRSTGTRADVLEVSERDSSLVLRAGILRISARSDEVTLIEMSGGERLQGSTKTPSVSPSASTEVDLRGMTSEEALNVLDLFLDGAFIAKLETVRIIHGKGTGVLRAAVQSHLRHHPQIKTFRLGRFGEGEDGVSVAELKNHP